MRKICTIIVLLFTLSNIAGLAQNKPVDQMTREDVLLMSYDQLADYPLEDLMKLAEIVGVSIDDLFNMILNKDVSIASKTNESFFDTPLSTSVITSEDIQRAGVLSIPEAMRLIPGVIVREKTNGNYDVHIRGNDNVPYGQQTAFSENTLTLVMIDGRPVYNYTTGGTFWESLPIGLNDIDRIEVVRGPASALYGANAVTGVINIITQKITSKKPSVEAGIQSGNRFGEVPSLLGVSGSQNLAVSFGLTDKLKFRFSGNYNYRDRAQEDIYLWKSSLTPALGHSGYYPIDSTTLVGKDPNDLYEDSSLGMDSYGVNGYMFYTPNANINIDLSVGTQRSTAISTNTDIGNIAHTTHRLETQYADIRTSIYGFNLQTSYMWGYEDLSMGSYGYQLDLGNFYANLDYNFQLLDNRMSIRPGLSYAHSMLNDIPYQVEGEDVFLNGKKSLSSFAPSLRVDYSPFTKLRLVGAFRYEQNAVPNKGYPTWQLVANYKLYETSSIRATYSRANRSPFMLDMKANASLVRPVPSPLPYLHSTDPADPKNVFTINLDGNPDLELATMDMFELGYRRKLGKHVLLNMEGFYSKLIDISCLTVDTVKMTLNRYNHTPYPYERHQTYKNLVETSEQFGATAEVGVVINKYVNFRLFGTYQYTRLKGHDKIGSDEKVQLVAVNVAKQGPSAWSDDMVESDIPSELIDDTNNATPSFYGGYEANWLPTDKWTITSTGYGFTNQTYIHQYGTFNVAAKMLVNMRVAYRFAKSSTIFMNVNNIFNSTTQEFGFMDITGAQWYWGVHVTF